jgi:hypothetical protein
MRLLIAAKNSPACPEYIFVIRSFCYSVALSSIYNAALHFDPDHYQRIKVGLITD